MKFSSGKMGILNDVSAMFAQVQKVHVSSRSKTKIDPVHRRTATGSFNQLMVSGWFGLAVLDSKDPLMKGIVT